MAHSVIPQTSARLRARICGALYVLCIGCGIFAQMGVRAKLVVYSDAAATAHNIATAPGLYRAGFFADVSAALLSIQLYESAYAISLGLFSRVRPEHLALARVASDTLCAARLIA